MFSIQFRLPVFVGFSKIFDLWTGFAQP